jgi:hypothetical protein
MKLWLFLILSFALISASSGAEFTDQDLQELLKKSADQQTSGIIWIWSPRMILSYRGYEELRPISLLLQLDVTYLVDPYVSEDDINQTAYNQDLLLSKKMHSNVLSQIGGLIHYPVLIIYQNGQIQLPSRPGYDEPWRLYDYLAKRLR